MQRTNRAVVGTSLTLLIDALERRRYSHGRVTSHLYRNAADTATIIGFVHSYDKVGNPEYEVRAHQSSEGDEYTYDALHRLSRAA